MYIVFCSALLAGLAYFLGKTRRVDFFSLGFLGACFYFLPGLFGFVFAFNRVDLGNPTEEILSETYLVMTLVLVSVTASAYLYDRKYGAKALAAVSAPPLGSPEKWAALLGTVGFGMALVTTGYHFLDEDKVEMMKFLDRWSLLWETGATVGLVLAFARRRWWPFALCALLLLADWGVGFRGNLILAVLSLGVYGYSRKGAIRLIQERKAMALVVVLAVFGFFVSGFIPMAKAGDLGKIKELISSPDFYVSRLILSESFNIQTTLNEVIGTKFRVGAGHLFSLIYVFVPFGNELGSRVVTFNDLFQERLFPGVEFGLAQNIWAQAWSIGGMFAVLVFIAVYIAVIWHGSRVLYFGKGFRRTFVVLMLTPWAFYIYRNDLLYQFIMERRILVMYVCTVGVASLLSGFGRPRRASIPNLVQGSPISEANS